MKLQLSAAALALAAFALPAQAQTEVQWWHSMGGALGEWVNDLAKDFNASQKDYKVMPTFKGSYDESMTAAHRRLSRRQCPAHPAGVRSRHGHHDGLQGRDHAGGRGHERWPALKFDPSVYVPGRGRATTPRPTARC